MAQGTSRQALGHHITVLVMPQAVCVSKGVWVGLTKDKKSGGQLRSDEAYMRGVAAKGQEGRWARVVPAFGTRVPVKFRRYRIGLMDGVAQMGMVARRVPKFVSVRKDLPGDVLDCPLCGILGSGNPVLLHCPRAAGVWGQALAEVGGDGQGSGGLGQPPAELK